MNTAHVGHHVQQRKKCLQPCINLAMRFSALDSWRWKKSNYVFIVQKGRFAVWFSDVISWGKRWNGSPNIFKTYCERLSKIIKDLNNTEEYIHLLTLLFKQEQLQLFSTHNCRRYTNTCSFLLLKSFVFLPLPTECLEILRRSCLLKKKIPMALWTRQVLTKTITNH